MLFIGTMLFMIIYQMLFSNNRIIAILGFLVCAIISGMANPVTTFDYPTYNMYYNLAPKGIIYFEKGYTWLGLIGSHFGMPYSEFRLVIVSVTCIILYIGVHGFVKNMALFISLYGLSIFLIDAIQVRSFMMISVVVLAAYFLRVTSKKNILIATILIIISAQFHSSGYVFLLLIIFRLINPKTFVRIIGLFSFINIFLLIITAVVGTTFIQNALNKVVSIFSSRANLLDKVSEQYTTGTSAIKITAVLICTVLMTAMCTYIFKNIQNKENQNKIKTVYAGVATGFVTIPLIALAYDYSRIQRSTFIFFIIAGLVYFESDEFKKRNLEFKLIFIIIFTIIIIINACVFCYFWSTSFRNSLPYLIRLK